ncbi:hypothetical protein [Lachnotalea glycerini]|uniref:Uncharacterized protein n=1 Tax=Lachnotalea glycerini TaxID=1763509 RepID=A0A371JIT9_9FIRM|nr:hypothetical protein [Lachnotalea glycerini]RDY32639.1 hypothetical protein CG710_004220 [Lachnotalea glycerini]
MKMTYDGALVMPMGCAIMDQEEMTYVDGGKSRSTNWISIPVDVAVSVAGINASAIVGLAGAAVMKKIALILANKELEQALKNVFSSAVVSFILGLGVTAVNNTVLSLICQCTSFGGIIGLLADCNDGKIDGKFNCPF